MMSKVSKESTVVDALEAWLEAGRSLLSSDPETFSKMLALARGYVSLHERQLEDGAVFRSRMNEIVTGSGKASA